MRECLNCTGQFQEKRSTAKFCSNKCRAAFSRKGGKRYQESIFEKILIAQGGLAEALIKIEQLVAGSPYDAPRLPKGFIGDKPLHPENIRAVLNYNELVELIGSATSSTQLHSAWKQVEKNKELRDWQIKELSQFKEDQRTKIDY